MSVMATSIVSFTVPVCTRELTVSVAILLFNEKERKTVEEVVHRMVKRAIEMEGTVTGEHGVGLVKRDYLKYELGESTVDAMRRVNASRLFRVYVAANPVFCNRSNRPMIPSAY
jgi:FAD linked oxidases, C-terminal domain